MASGNGQDLEQLRTQVGQLETQVANANAEAQAARQEAQAARAATAAAANAPARQGRHGGWRTPVASILIVLGCLLAPVSVLAVWSSSQISNTDRYVANVTPLIKEPAVQSALTSRITTAITREINIKADINRAAAELSKRGLTRLGGLIGGFSGSLASGVVSFIHSSVAKIISSPAAERIWVKVNTIAHTQLDRALAGQQHSAIVIQGNQVVLSLGPMIDQVKRDLAARGLTVVNKLPPVNPTFPLFNAKYLIKGQSLYRALNILKWVLPILAIVLLAAGIYIARGHRRALIWASLGMAGGMLLLAIGLAVGRAIYLNELPASASPDAASAVFDTLVRFIKQGLRVILAIGLVVALGAFFTGPSEAAVWTRDASTSAFAKIRGTRGGGPVGSWVYQHRTFLRIASVAVAALVFVLISYPSALVVLTIVLVLLAVLGLIELIGRPSEPGRSKPAGPGPAVHATATPAHQAAERGHGGLTAVGNGTRAGRPPQTRWAWPWSRKHR